jgi:putative glutamine amidotransferase
MSAPLVALTAGSQTASWGQEPEQRAAVLEWSYVAKVADAGGAPVLLPPVPEVAADIAARVDALLLTGGADIDPARYGALADPHTEPPDSARDEAELAALSVAERRGIPVLAICRGLQLLSVARGGTLHQHLPWHAPTAPGRFDRRRIRIKSGSHIAAALGGTAVLDCYHHQGVDKLGDGLEATAWSEDGGLEGAEDPGAPFVVGIQAHPEEGQAGAALFAAFVAAARHPSRVG